MRKLLLLSFLFFGITALNQIHAQTKKNSVKKSTAKSSSSKKTIVTKSKSADTEKTYNGHKVYTGPKGGKYYINSHGKKTYIKQ